MYVLFGFQCLLFSSVYGEMIECFVGGIVKYNTLNDDITKMQEQYCNTLVKAFRKDEWKQILNIEIDTDSTDLPFMTNGYRVGDYYSEITRNAGLKPIQSVHVFHETHSRLVEYWDDIVRIGTDTHRLKFHSKLITLLRNFYIFTAEEILVFLKSNYSAVGIYYLTNNKSIARNLANDGIQVLSMYKNYLYRSTDINILDIFMWEILTHIALIETQDISDENNNVANIVLDFQSLQTKFNQYILKGYDYPCSYLLKFRSVLLDKKLVSDNSSLEECFSLIKTDSIKNCGTHSDNKTYQLYMNIISSMYNPEIEYIQGLTSFYHLIDALKIPVFTSEERLINYKVTTMAMKKMSDCVNENVEWLEYDNNCLCNTLKTNREHDKDLDNILTKLTYMQVYQITNDDFDFIPNYLNSDGTINENKLHMIVTMGLDNMDNNFDLSSKRVKIIKTTITRLTNDILKLQDTKPIKYFKKLGLTDKKEYFRVLMRAHKWLAELHGVLCTDRYNVLEIKTHQEALETSLTIAITLQGQHNFDDDHLKFLYYKKICKDSQLSYSWEGHYIADGWIQNSPNNSEGYNSDSIFRQGHECNGVSKFLGINNQFIHQADVNILMFKYLMMTYNMNISIENYVQKAFSQWVVTSEDRVRNLQAHDLYSMYFVWENYRIVKEQGTR